MQSSQSTRKLALDLNISQSSVCSHFKKIGKVSKLGIWFPHTLCEKNKEDQELFNAKAILVEE